MCEVKNERPKEVDFCHSFFPLVPVFLTPPLVYVYLLRAPPTGQPWNNSPFFLRQRGKHVLVKFFFNSAVFCRGMPERKKIWLLAPVTHL